MRSILASVLLAGAAHGKLTVHLVPHTHDDVGWLKTADEYFSGANQSIQHAGVRNVLNAVFLSLEENPERKFTYVEQAFFQRWWRELSDTRKAAVRKLVKNGQLGFVNGGWCMHDEAATHFVDMIDQTTLGHRFLKNEFGVAPTVGWQIDPFGHSTVQEALLSGEAGFDSLFFGRIDYQDLQLRQQEKRPEFIWRASPSLGADAQVFTGLTGEYRGNYGPPQGFDWEHDDTPVEDDPTLETYNVPARLEDFIQRAMEQAAMTRGEHIMFTMGSDFNYERAEIWFTNMDKIIKAANEDGRIAARYSTPMDYVAAKRAEKNVTWPLKYTDQGDDFFPYADGPHMFWTGYFTSRPAVKGYVRELSALQQAARQVQALAGTKDFKKVGAVPELIKLEEALGIGQHHDAVSGTEKQHVAFDYAKRLAIGEVQGDAVLSSGLSLLADTAEWNRCRRLNETVCAETQREGTTGMLVWNQLAQARDEYITVPVSSNSVTVKNSKNEAVPVQVDPAPETVTNYQRATGEASFVATFKAQLPPVGYETFSISQSSSEEIAPTKPTSPSADIVLENEFISMTFSAETGRLASMENKKSGIKVAAEQNFCYYTSNEGDDVASQKSGAYIFRPRYQHCEPISVGKTDIQLVQGPLTQEVRQTFGLSGKTPWLTQTVRLGKDDRFARFEFTVGSVPLCKIRGCVDSEENDDVSGKEVVSRFNTSIASAAEILTDSNGRDMLLRKRDYRPSWKLQQTEPIAGNYYPVNSAVAMRDDKAQFTILVDRAHGAGSISDGELELMVHRRTLVDDNRGVGEALNETQVANQAGTEHIGPGLVIRGTHLVSLEPPASASSIWRPLADRVFAKPVIAFRNAADTTAPFSALAEELPSNVQIMTLQALSEKQILLRLSHQFGLSEDSSLSQVVGVDLKRMFNEKIMPIVNIREVSLTNNQDKHELLRKRRANTEWPTADKSVPHPWRNSICDFSKNSTVVLGPLEIKTFILELSEHSPELETVLI